MTQQTIYNQTDDILAQYDITPDANGDLTFEENKENGYYVTARRVSLREARDWDAYDAAVDAGIVGADIDSYNDLPDDVYVWRLDDPQIGRYEADEAEARAWFVESVDWYYHNFAELLDEKLGTPGFSHPHAWMTKGVSDDHRSVTPDEYAEVLVQHVEPQLLNEKVARHVVSEFRRISPYLFTQMWLDYRPDMSSEAGSLNLYMPEGYKSAAKYIAMRNGVFDNRGNPSVSALIRKLIEGKIAGGEK